MNSKLLEINKVAWFSFKLHGYEESAYIYIIDLFSSKDVYLERGWIDYYNVIVTPAKKSIYIYLKSI